MTYANYACLQKGAPNGTKTKKEKKGKQAENTMKNKQNKTNKQERTNNVMEEWLNYKTQLRKALAQIYPRRKKRNSAEP